MTKEEIYNLLLLPKGKGGLNQIQEKGFSETFPDEYAVMLTWLFPKEFSFRQKLYHYLLNDKDLKIGVCHCGKRCSFNGFKKGYNTYCCNSHAQKSKETLLKKEETCLQKYGNKNYNNRHGAKQTCLEKYGVDNPQKLKETQEKVQKTKTDKYGSPTYTNPNKTKETKLKRYGNTNYNNQEKTKETCLKRYGVENVFSLNETKEKAKQTNLKNIGCEYSMQSVVVKEKAKKTSQTHYGTNHPSQSVIVKEKVKETNNKLYGKDYYQQTEDGKKRIENTNIEKYGNACSLHGIETEAKTRETNIKKYGTPYPTQNKEVKRKTKETNFKRYGCAYTSQNQETREKTRLTNQERYGVDWCCQRKEARLGYKNDSKPNKRFSELLSNAGIKHEREFHINGYSYDFKIENILVEINPTITHNSLVNVFGGEPLRQDYHKSKTLAAQKAGYRCVHVWDWDNVAKIIGLLMPKTVIYARSCEIKTVEKNEAVEFLNLWHLQGSCRGIEKSYGLYHNGVLVQLMSFGKPRYNKNYEWELLRLCTQSEFLVVGGSKRLFDFFKKDTHPKNVVSYCDLSKFVGNVYESLGFEKIKETNPSLHWWNGKRHITNNLLVIHGADRLLGTTFGKGSSNEEILKNNGYLPVWDCGQVTYTLNCNN